VKWGWAAAYPRSLETAAATAACLAMRGRGEVGGLKTWEDISCSEQHHFLCEYLWLDELLAEDAEGEEPGKARLARKLEESLVGVATERQARILDRN